MRHFKCGLVAILLTAGNSGICGGAEPAAKPGAPITVYGEEIDPDSDCDVTEADGGVTITVPGTWHDLTHTEEYSRHNAPRLLDDVDGDFSIRSMSTRMSFQTRKTPAADVTPSSARAS